MKKDLLGWTFMTRPWNKKIAKQERLTEEVINRLVKERYPFRTDADYAPPALTKTGLLRKGPTKIAVEAGLRYELAAHCQLLGVVVILLCVATVVLPGGLIIEGSPVRGDTQTPSPFFR